MPTEAQAATPVGAATFARHWYDALDRAFASREPEVLERLSTPECAGCQAFIDSVRRIRDNGESVIGADFVVRFAEAPGFEGDRARVDVTWDGTGAQIVDAAGEVVFSEPARQGYRDQLTLSRSGDGWLVDEILVIDRPTG